MKSETLALLKFAIRYQNQWHSIRKIEQDAIKELTDLGLVRVEQQQFKLRIPPTEETIP